MMYQQPSQSERKHSEDVHWVPYHMSKSFLIGAVNNPNLSIHAFRNWAHTWRQWMAKMMLPC